MHVSYTTDIRFFGISLSLSRSSISACITSGSAKIPFAN